LGFLDFAHCSTADRLQTRVARRLAIGSGKSARLVKRIAFRRVVRRSSATSARPSRLWRLAAITSKMVTQRDSPCQKETALRRGPFLGYYREERTGACVAVASLRHEFSRLDPVVSGLTLARLWHGSGTSAANIAGCGRCAISARACPSVICLSPFRCVHQAITGNNGRSSRPPVLRFVERSNPCPPT
jgi:hypothetical protein